MLNYEAKKYFKQIKRLLPLLSKQERRFLKDLKANIEDYASRHHDATAEKLSDELGKPNDIVHDYIESVELDYLIKKISTRTILRRTTTIMLLIIFLAFLIFSGSIYLAYMDAHNSVITHEVTIIE